MSGFAIEAIHPIDLNSVQERKLLEIRSNG